MGLLPQSVSFEEQLEVVTRAVAKLNIEWPADKERQERPKSKVDKRLLRSRSRLHAGDYPFPPIYITNDLDRGISRTRLVSSTLMF